MVCLLSRNDILGWFARVECRVDTDCDQLLYNAGVRRSETESLPKENLE